MEQDLDEAKELGKKLSTVKHNIPELIQESEECYRKAQTYKIPSLEVQEVKQEPSEQPNPTIQTNKKSKSRPKKNLTPKEFVLKDFKFKEHALTIASLYALHSVMMAILLRFTMFQDFALSLFALLSIVGSISWFSGLIFNFSTNQIAKVYAIASVCVAACGTLLFHPNIELRLFQRLMVGAVAVLPFACSYWLTKTWLLQVKNILLIFAAVSTMGVTFVLHGLHLSQWWYYELSIAMMCLSYVWYMYQGVSSHAHFYPIAIFALYIIPFGMDMVYYVDLLAAGVIAMVVYETGLSKSVKWILAPLLIWGATSVIHLFFSVA